MKTHAFQLPLRFLLGAATAPTQIEGGAVDSNWADWAAKGHIKDGTSPARATDHVRHWREDVALMRDMGLQVYRLGIEWARLEPEEGRFDREATAFYRDLLTALREAGIKPLLTLHHFTNPMWFEEAGAFEKPDNIRYFLRFVEYTVEQFGDLVSEYITINEPNVYATYGYFFGLWPPGRADIRMTLTVISVLACCHIEAYKIIHAKRAAGGFTDTKVSFAHHMRVFTPKNRFNPWHRLCAFATEYLFQTLVTHAFYTGRFLVPLQKPRTVKRGEYADFIALNYYTRSTVSGFGDGVMEDAPKNDLQWEIYPEGLAACARALYRVLAKPVWVTENGTCDRDDAFRSRYLYDHLRVVASSGLPVERYYHWCFCDNFEWVEGENARFGLVHTDFETQQRTVKKSGLFYTEVIKQAGVTEELYEAYVRQQGYHLRNSLNAATIFSSSID